MRAGAKIRAFSFHQKKIEGKEDDWVEGLLRTA